MVSILAFTNNISLETHSEHLELVWPGAGESAGIKAAGWESPNKVILVCLRL